jgi:hypothetical protein
VAHPTFGAIAYTPLIDWQARVHVLKSSEPRGHALQSKSVGSVTFFIGSINTYFRASGKLRAVQFVFHKRQMQP